MTNPNETTRLLNSTTFNPTVFEGDDTIGTSHHSDILNLSDDETSQLEEGNHSSEIPALHNVINIGIASSPFLVATKDQTIVSPYKGFHGGRYIVEDGFSKLKGLKLYGTYTPTDNPESICIPNPARKNNPLAPPSIIKLAAGYVKLHTKWHGAYARYESFKKAEEPTWGNVPTHVKRRLQRFSAEWNKAIGTTASIGGFVGMLGFLGVTLWTTILVNKANNVATTDELVDIIGAGGDKRKVAKEVINSLKHYIHLSAILVSNGNVILFLVVSAMISLQLWNFLNTLNLQSRASFAGPIENINFGPTDLIALPQGVEDNETPNYVEYQGKYYIVLDEPENIAEKIVEIAETGTQAPAVEIPEPNIIAPNLVNPKSRNLGGNAFGTGDVQNVFGSGDANLTQNNLMMELMINVQNRMPQEQQSKAFKVKNFDVTLYLKQHTNLFHHYDSGFAVMNFNDIKDFAKELAQGENHPETRALIAQVVKNIVNSEPIYHTKQKQLPENLNKLYYLNHAQVHFQKLMDHYVEIYKEFYPNEYSDTAPSFAEMLISIEQNPVRIKDLPTYGQLQELSEQQAARVEEIEELAQSPEVYSEFMEFLGSGGQITPALIKAYCLTSNQYCRIWTLDAENPNRLHYDAANSHITSAEREIIDIIYAPNGANLGHFYRANPISQEEYQQLKRPVSSNVSSLFGSSSRGNNLVSLTEEQINLDDDEYSHSSSHSSTL